MSEPRWKNVSFRMETDLVRRLDLAVDRVREGLPGHKVSRATIVRACLLDYLAKAEQEAT